MNTNEEGIQMKEYNFLWLMKNLDDMSPGQVAQLVRKWS